MGKRIGLILKNSVKAHDSAHVKVAQLLNGMERDVMCVLGQ